MALINCPDCGTEVSDAADACPKCARPIATTAAHSQQAETRPKKSAKVTITVSTFVLVIAGILAAIWFVPPLQVGQNLSTNCQVNAFGNGSCQFSNTGWTPGSQCVVVRLSNGQGGSTSSGPVCSGTVWPNDSASKSVSLVIGSICDDASGQADLSSACKMDILTAGSSTPDLGAAVSSAQHAPVASAATAAVDQRGYYDVNDSVRVGWRSRECSVQQANR